jgi:Family of unknown function (DUF6152)
MQGEGGFPLTGRMGKRRCNDPVASVPQLCYFATALGGRGRQRSNWNPLLKGETRMRKFSPFLVCGALLAASAAALAHHSFAMFDQENPIDLVGKVKEFKFTSPHTFILLEVKGADGSTTVWNLEGGSPSALVRDGWTSKSLPSGTELKMKIDPLRSGAPGGAWGVAKTKKMDGSAVVSH